ncbi:MAG TPA: Bcr/CflA family efflux MFS transporter, partial [Spirochaetia bacterium]|nr:Bcr/CflA family efflux MFS transporter [Spirochaetia bacterium]
MTRKERTGIIILLGALSALGPFSIDMYLPGFPSIAASLKTSVAVVGYSLTSYFIGISFGQLIYGPLTDRFGRKIPLLVGLGLYLVAAAACAFSSSIAWLVITRFLMALGVCVGMVASRAIVRDLFPINEIAGVFSAFMLIIAVSPMLAPSAGGFVASHLGWRFIFIILVLFAAILIVTVALLLSESKRPDPLVSMKPGRIIAQYMTVAKNRQFLVYAVVSGLGSAGLFAYISDSSYVFMQLFGLTQTQFGWAFSLNAAGLIIGSQVNRFLLRRYSSRQITGVCVR